MKKKLIGILAVSALALTLAGCGNSDKAATDGSGKKEETTTLKVGASPTPHAEILEFVKPQLEKEGITLEIETFNDYVLPNKALEEKEIDANYFQHIPFFDLTVKESGYDDFVNKGAIHIELMALYSQRIKDIKDLKDGATIITSNSESDWGRIITMLQDEGLVKVKEGTDLTTATFDDIVENPKKLKFNHDVNPELLAATYENDEADLVAINANFAGGIDLSPEKDGVIVEKDNSPYGNILAVRTDNEDDPAIEALFKALRSKETQEWITEKWDGKIKPVSE
ncbi:methionine ABC transporter substrate-binding protein [Vagococcus sp. BWB3-3]|uniref:Lipoprotein n=1 Tax=Vagococcus allomyrinae TaxID=2794353 RepID=A0A940PDV6_9ENTE|nr:MetQ/NlpA family ABC transporter substrate-binding protein [Vagococcus allomyrinae]MBP1043104.1 methionine ABC transporter substrate-binding protein [Vagococcus allomyrinae]